jgi:RimJ/RimL family protein N-acetyltransferase
MIQRLYWALSSKFTTSKVRFYCWNAVMTAPTVRSDLILENITADRFKSWPHREHGKTFERLDQGHRCLAFLEDGTIASHFWVTNGKSLHSLAPWECQLNLIIPADTDYIWDCATAPTYRNRGLYQNGLAKIMTTAAQAKRRVIIYCRDDNFASRKAIERVGFSLLTTLELKRFGPIARLRSPDKTHWRIIRQNFLLPELAVTFNPAQSR